MKKLTALLLALVTIIAVVVPTALTASAATAINLSVPFFCQRSANVCVNACLSMVEAYDHGYGQNNDYVYETVMEYNPNAYFGTNLGYTLIDCNLQTVYNQLAAKKPVIIQRKNKSTEKTHFCVVYAYQPTSTSLQACDFKVLNPYLSSTAGAVVGPGTVGYKDMEEWLSGCTWVNARVKTSNKIPVVDSGTAKYSFSYNANGGSGTISGSSVYFGQKVNIAANAFTKTGYDFAGYYTVKRSDGKAYVSGSTSGWFTESEITANGYTKKQYKPGESYSVSNAWTEGASTKFSYTFYAQWTPKTYNILTYENHTAKNYMLDSAFTKGFNETYWKTRDASVATLSCDTTVKRVAEYNTLKIVNTQAGSSSGSKDLAFVTATNRSAVNESSAGDTKEMTLSFWAKSSVAGSKMYFRWGWESTYDSITLNTDWTYYTISMNKESKFGSNIHPYVDSIGTVWISEMQMEDGTEATEFVNETGAFKLITATYEGTYSALPAPTREGYTFDGWYTEKAGGTKITSETAVLPYGIALYAHWTKTAEEYDVLTIGTNYAVISVDGEKKRYTFTPDTTQTYSLYSVGEDDTCVEIYDESGNLLAYNDDTDLGINFGLEYTFEKGKTYTVVVFYTDYVGVSETGTIEFKFEKVLAYDVNGDGKFNMFDYVAVKGACLKGTDDEALFSRADVNGDGKLNMFDYAIVKNAYFVK